MRVKIILLLTFSLLLGGCNLPQGGADAQPQAAAPSLGKTLPPATPTQIPPTASPLPKSSPTPQVLPSPTAPLPDGTPLPSLAAGQPVTLTYIHMIDVLIGWGVGYQVEGEDHILRTTDGGATWLDVSPPAGGPPPAIPDSPAALFRDNRIVWVAYPVAPEQPPVVWRTADGGVTWQAAPLPATSEADFFSPSFFAADGENGWLLVTVGAGMQHAYSDLYATKDGGATWEKIADPFSPGASDLMLLPHTGIAFKGTTGWVTKDNGVMDGVALVTSTDGGATWLMPTPPNPASTSIMCSTYAPTLFAPDRGYYLTTCWDYQTDEQLAYFTAVADGQTTYTPLPSVVDELIFFSPQQGLALGCRDWGAPDPLQCDILSTRDNGQSWALVKTVNWDGQFSFVDELHGWAVARNGEEIALVYTQDGGQTWQLLEPRISGE